MAKQDGIISVVGAVNIDICGTSLEPIIPGDSNPGRVAVSLGGVGRNIADNLSRLGAPVRLITVLGDDGHGIQALNSCRDLGIDMSLSSVVPGETTSTYLCINDADGDVSMAISHMDICRHISPAFLLERMDDINRSALVVMDANLAEEAIACLCENCVAPIFADPVSVKKSVRLKAHLDRIFCLKPNRAEAEILADMTIYSQADIEQAASILRSKGVKLVFISLGADGVYYDDGESRGMLPCYPGTVVDTTGCGDAFMAAVACGFFEGAAMKGIAQMGLASASLCAQAKGAVRSDITRMLLDKKIDDCGGKVQ